MNSPKKPCNIKIYIEVILKKNYNFYIIYLIKLYNIKLYNINIYEIYNKIHIHL